MKNARKSNTETTRLLPRQLTTTEKDNDMKYLWKKTRRGEAEGRRKKKKVRDAKGITEGAGDGTQKMEAERRNRSVEAEDNTVKKEKKNRLDDDDDKFKQPWL